MFFGETTINLDAKGRLAVPMRYRDALVEQCQNRLVLTYSAFESGALWLQPEKYWEKARDDVMALSISDPSHRALQRRLVGSAMALEPDGNGRILLSPSLRQSAGMEKRVILLGMGKRFEIWNEETLHTQRDEELLSFEQPSEEMKKLVF